MSYEMPKNTSMSDSTRAQGIHLLDEIIEQLTSFYEFFAFETSSREISQVNLETIETGIREIIRYFITYPAIDAILMSSLISSQSVLHSINQIKSNLSLAIDLLVENNIKQKKPLYQLYTDIQTELKTVIDTLPKKGQLD